MEGKIDNRIILRFNNVSYTVSDIVNIYAECEDSINDSLGNLKSIYDFFKLKPKNEYHLSIYEVKEELAKSIDYYLSAIMDKDAFLKEIRKALRKFFYWQPIDKCIYILLNGLCATNNNYDSKPFFSDDKSLYDQIILHKFYIFLIDSYDVDTMIANDRETTHKTAIDYVEAVKRISTLYKVSEELEYDIDSIFTDIYNKIQTYNPENIYVWVNRMFSSCYGESEERIELYSKYNNVLPTLWHLTLKLITSGSKNEYILNADTQDYYQLISDLNQAIILLDADNDNDIRLLFPNQETDYLERLMSYSAIYDLHQYDIEGVIYLLKRIIMAFPDEIKKYYGLSAECVYETIVELVKLAHQRFINNGFCILINDEVSERQRIIIDKMCVGKPLNVEYITPVQWDKVNDDSEWILKKEDKYFILPPVLSALGIYDNIGKAVGWKDFGPQLETAVKELFSDKKGISVYSGKYAFENKVYEADVIVVGMDFALLIECKRKGISRKARGGDREKIIKDVAETFFSSQKQAYHTYRATLENRNKLALYKTECKDSAILNNSLENDDSINVVDFSNIKNIIRISCTASNFWCASENVVLNNIERLIDMNSLNIEDNQYIEEYLIERNLALEKASALGQNPKAVKRNSLFISFDKLYSIVNKCNDIDLLNTIYELTFIQSKKLDTPNHYSFFQKF